MGFAWDRIPLLRNAFRLRGLNFVPFGPDDIRIVADNPAWSGGLEDMRETFDFRPHFGWRGAVEAHREAAPV
jgi:hypothetical protein